MGKFFTIGSGDLSAELCFPSDSESYYRGTRFDWSGIFRRITYKGHVYADQWFDTEDPLRHDNVCGPSEEFVIFDSERSRKPGPFVKIGVGLLMKPDCDPYDRFRLYPIIDGGVRRLETGKDFAEFTQELENEYLYVKRISAFPDGTMEISHSLENTSSVKLDSWVYNHNFFTLDNLEPGPDTLIEFPFDVSGHWRDRMEEVSIEGSRIVFSSHLQKGGKSAFIGDLHAENPFSFKTGSKRTGISVEYTTDAPVAYSIFWSDYRISCIEPYTKLSICPGETRRWTIRYRFIA